MDVELRHTPTSTHPWEARPSCKTVSWSLICWRMADDPRFADSLGGSTWFLFKTEAERAAFIALCQEVDTLPQAELNAQLDAAFAAGRAKLRAGGVP